MRAREAQAYGELGQGGTDRAALLGGDPPHQIVFAGVPVDVFDGELGLADAAQTVERTGKPGRPLGGQPAVQLFEQRLTADKAWIATGDGAPDARLPGRYREPFAYGRPGGLREGVAAVGT